MLCLTQVVSCGVLIGDLVVKMRSVSAKRKKNKSTNKKGLYTKAEVEKAILINTIKKEQD